VTDRPIIFSAPMVRALLSGRKTQTRRLATSPLRKCLVGDRLYVREAWYAARSLDRTKPSLIPLDADIEHAATARSYAEIGLKGRIRPGMHMPRWASRLTLIVEGVRVEPLQAISEADAIAEGVIEDPDKGFCVPGVEHPNRDFPWLSRSTARGMYGALWDTLHGPGQWLGNPDVVALTFRVVLGNIDRPPP